jgi:hypothetical protein
MALKAGLGQNAADIPIEFEARRGGAQPECCQQAGKDEA